MAENNLIFECDDLSAADSLANGQTLSAAGGIEDVIGKLFVVFSSWSETMSRRPTAT